MMEHDEVMSASSQLDSPEGDPIHKAKITHWNDWLVRVLSLPQLPLLTVVVGVGLALPSLFIGFHLDDLIGRFIFSDLPGAERLYSIYGGGYGAANGNPSDATWMMEEGYAPWWMTPDLLLQFYRPISLSTHLLDAALWPSSSILWHAHSLLWFGVMLACATLAYRSMQGRIVGGLAALLFAVDHTHAYPVGFITHRYSMISTAFCMLVLYAHHRFGSTRSVRYLALSAGFYALALLSGESSVAIVGYVLAYVVFVERAALRARALSFAPYLVITLGWRMLYNALGRGAHGSDLYIDPAREPLRFAAAALERGPVLLVGQWAMPPAETYGMADASDARLLVAFAWLFTLCLAVALWPLLRRDRMARFWTAGMLMAIVLTCSGDPANRMLFGASIGAAGLIAQWWDAYRQNLLSAGRAWLERLSRGFAVLTLAGHLLLSPWLVPVNASSLLLLQPLKNSFDDVGAEAAGKTAVFVTLPDYFAMRLMRMTKSVAHAPMPETWRGLYYGPEPVTIARTGERTLVMDIEGGAMRLPAPTKQALDLYRSRATPMSAGDRVSLDGLDIEVLSVTDDGRPLRVRFDFAHPLEDPRYRYYHWVDNHFRPLQLPAIGESRTLPPAIMEMELPDDLLPALSLGAAERTGE